MNRQVSYHRSNTLMRKQPSYLPKVHQKQHVNDKVEIKVFEPRDVFVKNKLSDKKEMLLDFPLENLKGLYKDVKFYKTELTKDSKNPIRIRLMGAADLQKKLNELDEILREIEEFAESANINLNEDDISGYKFLKVKRTDIEEQSKLLNTPDENTDDNTDNIILTNDLSEKQKELLSYRLDILISKLKNLEDIIGIKDVFKDQSVFAKFQQSINDINLLDPETIAHTIKKLEMVVSDLKKMIEDKKMNFFSKTQKNELVQFLDNLEELATDIFNEMEKDYQKAEDNSRVIKTIQMLENSANDIEAFSQSIERMNNQKSLISHNVSISQDNNAILTNLKQKRAENKEVIQKNLNEFS